MKLKWEDSLSVDHGVIDHDHKLAIGMANKFIDMHKKFSSRKEAKKFLVTLRDNLIEHCDHEEQILKKICFDEFESHRLSHVDMIKNLDQIIERLYISKNIDLHDISITTMHFFKDFLVRHVLEDDMKIRDFIQMNITDNDNSEKCSDVVYI